MYRAMSIPKQPRDARFSENAPIAALNDLERAGYYTALFSLLTFGKQGLNDNALNPAP